MPEQNAKTSLYRPYEEGVCSICKTWQPIAPESFANAPQRHYGPDGQFCKGAGYTANETRYVVRGSNEARGMAELIRDHREHRHNLGCGDGRRCQAEYQQRAKALAVYVLGGAA